jgi:hypothetical protein
VGPCLTMSRNRAAADQVDDAAPGDFVREK